MSPMDRKLQRMMASETKAKVASCWLPIIKLIGAVITHSTCNHKHMVSPGSVNAQHLKSQTLGITWQWSQTTSEITDTWYHLAVITHNTCNRKHLVSQGSEHTQHLQSQTLGITWQWSHTTLAIKNTWYHQAVNTHNTYINRHLVSSGSDNAEHLNHWHLVSPSSEHTQHLQSQTLGINWQWSQTTPVITDTR